MKIVRGVMNTSKRSKQKETLSQVDHNLFFRLVCIFVYVEKVVNANAKADPMKSIKKQQYLFGANIKALWDALPDHKVSSFEVSKCLVQIYNFASRRDAVCVRTLLNACLVLLNHVKDLGIYHNHDAYFGGAESAVCKLLEHYDPNLDHDKSQEMGDEIAKEILAYLEMQPCL
jgi:hypothetical protein